MRPLKILLQPDTTVENGLIAQFEGDFDGSSKENLEELQQTIETCASGTVIFFDFSELNYLNSVALSQMVEWHELIGAKDGKILIVGANDHIKDIFMVLGVDSIFQTYGALEEAKIALNNSN